MKDSTGRTLQIGDSVEVPNPQKNDMWNHEFVGVVDSFRDGDVVVCDGDNDCFAIEPNRLTFYDEAETQKVVDGYIKARNN
jgi:hypothetical protein